MAQPGSRLGTAVMLLKVSLRGIRPQALPAFRSGAWDWASPTRPLGKYARKSPTEGARSRQRNVEA